MNLLFRFSIGRVVSHVWNVQWKRPRTYWHFGFRHRRMEFSIGGIGWNNNWSVHVNNITFRMWILILTLCISDNRCNMGFYDWNGDTIHGKCTSDWTNFHICYGISGLFECWNATLEWNIVVSTILSFQLLVLLVAVVVVIVLLLWPQHQPVCWNALLSREFDLSNTIGSSVTVYFSLISHIIQPSSIGC